MTERRDPSDLRLHPLQKRLPEPDKNSREWISFMESIRRNGILENLLVTKDGQIMDGGWRWRAAKALKLDEVAVTVRDESEAALIIVESLIHRKQMTRGACVYLALGLQPEFVASANNRRLANLKQGNKIVGNALKLPKSGNRTSEDTTDESVADFCDRWGIGRDTYYRAVRVRALLDGNDGLKAEFEPELLNGEKSLWNVESAIKGRDPSNQSTREGAKAESQLELFTDSIGTISTSVKFWNKFPQDKREKLRKDWIKTIKALPQELKDATLEVLEGVPA